MTDLSPAADAVLDAYMANCGWLDGPLEKDYRCAAAVLRAAADQVMPMTPEPTGAKPTAAWHRWNVTGALRLNLLSIAAELEKING